MSENIQFTKDQLMNRIQYVYETDLGDFKRIVALYLNRFSQSQKDLAFRKKLQELKNTVLYREASSQNQMEDIDHLRFEILNHLKQM